MHKGKARALPGFLVQLARAFASPINALFKGFNRA